MEDAQLTGRKMATVSELVKMGYDREFVESKASGADQLQYNVERRERKDRTLDFTYRTDGGQVR